MNPITPGDKVEFGVSEPADFFLEAGDGPYIGRVLAADDDNISITLEPPLHYAGNTINRCIARCRYGESFLDWDGGSARIVNLIVNVPRLSHLIGGIKVKEITQSTEQSVPGYDAQGASSPEP